MSRIESRTRINILSCLLSLSLELTPGQEVYLYARRIDAGSSNSKINTVLPVIPLLLVTVISTASARARLAARAPPNLIPYVLSRCRHCSGG